MPRAPCRGRRGPRAAPRARRTNHTAQELRKGRPHTWWPNIWASGPGLGYKLRGPRRRRAALAGAPYARLTRSGGSLGMHRPRALHKTGSIAPDCWPAHQSLKIHSFKSFENSKYGYLRVASGPPGPPGPEGHVLSLWCTPFAFPPFPLFLFLICLLL